jgi:hypothetical protein
MDSMKGKHGMNTNTAVQTQNPPQMPARAERHNANGKLTGYVQHFTGSLSAKMLKEALKAKGVKGKELTKMVNETLRGEKDLRQQIGVACIQAAIQAGYIPDCFEENKAGTKGVFRMVKPEVVKEKTISEQIAELAAKKAELSAADLATLKALTA